MSHRSSSSSWHFIVEVWDNINTSKSRHNKKYFDRPNSTWQIVEIASTGRAALFSEQKKLYEKLWFHFSTFYSRRISRVKTIVKIDISLVSWSIARNKSLKIAFGISRVQKRFSVYIVADLNCGLFFANAHKMPRQIFSFYRCPVWDNLICWKFLFPLFVVNPRIECNSWMSSPIWTIFSSRAFMQKLN
jgi:hypothetical protein